MLLEVTPSLLQVIWFILVAVLWVGFFFLEGFDFGAGMLVPFLGKNDQGRRVVINTIGPHWDGNEVWLLTAGGAMFAAFPGWYASLFSGLYLPLLLVLLGLIVRGVALEYRSKRDDKTWRTAWDWALSIGSFIPPLVFGVGFANFVKGVPVDLRTYQDAWGGAIPVYGGTFLGLFTPFTLIGGLLFVALFLAHGAFFVGLKTKGEIHDRAREYGNILAIVAAVLALAFVVWGNLGYFGTVDGQLPLLGIVAWVCGGLAVVGIAFGWFMNSKDRDGWAFIGSAVGTATLTVMVFCHMYPRLGFAEIADLTILSSSATTLTLMTVAAGCLVPVVLAYTIWSYFFVFRRRLNVTNIPALEVTTAA